MFTGIVSEIGIVQSLEQVDGGTRIRIQADRVLSDAEIDDSIAINGCCLTVTERGPNWWVADVMLETLQHTNLGALRPGNAVNMERPLRLGDRLDGHMVQGHVDGTAEVAAVQMASDGSALVTMKVPPALSRYIVSKGSITVNGVSLTIARCDADEFTVSLIPHTQQVTTLGQSKVGEYVNLEVDVLAKYVESLLPSQEKR